MLFTTRTNDKLVITEVVNDTITIKQVLDCTLKGLGILHIFIGSSIIVSIIYLIYVTMISEIMSLNRNYLFYQTINKSKWQNNLLL